MSQFTSGTGGLWKRISGFAGYVGSAILVGANNYFNFNTTTGETGYGFRDNAGAMEYKDDAGAWTGFNTFGPAFDTGTIVTHNLNALGGELLDYDLGSASYVSAGYRVVVDNNGKVVTI